MFAKLRSSFSPSAKPTSADNNDGRRQNRLSKPPMNASSLNLSSLSLLQVDNRHSTMLPLSTSTEELQDHCPLSPNDEPRELLKARLFSPDVEYSQAPLHLETKSWKGAHFVGNDIETQHSTCPLPGSPLISPLSPILNTSRLSLVSSKECKDARERISPRTENRSGDSPREELSSPIPVRRKSLRQPGIATRIQKEDRWGPSPPCAAGVDVDRDDYYNPVVREEAPHVKLDALNLEAPNSRRPARPPLVRTETPSDLVFLGALKLGSLHVTNGRASPAPSDLSRRVKARSTPNLRVASSEYGDSDYEDGDTDVPDTTRDGSRKKPKMPEVPSRSTPQGLCRQLSSRFSNDDSVPMIQVSDERVGKSSQMHKAADGAHSAKRSPDRASFVADEYMSELAAGPFAVARCSSASGSVLKPTTKTTEFDDKLFDDESVGPSDSESNSNSTLDTLYSSSNDVTAAQDRQKLLQQKPRPTCALVDSGYSSNISLHATRETVDHDSTAELIESTKMHRTARNSPENELTIPKKRQDRRPGPRPLRPSILKQAGATTTSLPVFDHLRHSTATITTIMTTASTPATLKPNKLAKLRRLSRSTPPREIAIPGNHEILTNSIPPIPAEIAANLAIRSHQVPELEHTFEIRQHTAESPTTSHFDPVEIRFPSPAASLHTSDRGSSTPPRPPAHRASTFRRRSKSGRRQSVHAGSNEMSEADALAMIRDFGTVGHALGGNPYDIARTDARSTPESNVGASRKINPHRFSGAAKLPKSTEGMDAETAAELARIRSRSIYERDSMSVAEKRTLFNDRGGVPGKNLRPTSLAADIPPLPCLPASFDPIRRQSWAAETADLAIQRSHGCRNDNYPPVIDKTSCSEIPTTRSVLNLQQTYNIHSRCGDYRSDDSHSEDERRQSWRSDGVQIDFDHRQSWTSDHALTGFERGRNWNRRSDEVGFDRQYQNKYCYEDDRFRTTASFGSQHGNRQYEKEEDAAPPPPPHSPRPTSLVPESGSIAWVAQAQERPTKRDSVGERRLHSYQQNDGLYPEIPFRSAPSKAPFVEPYAEEAYLHNQYPQTYGSQPPTPYSSYYGPNNGQYPSRPDIQARSHHRSYAGSHGGNVHPSPGPPQVRPRPQFGRYSGGLNYAYEHGSGFGGSAGTRSISGVAAASRKGKELSQGFGVDLSDVPIIGGLKKL